MKKPQLDTPRNGKAWCNVVNTMQLPKKDVPKRIVIGSMSAEEYRNRKIRN